MFTPDVKYPIKKQEKRHSFIAKTCFFVKFGKIWRIAFECHFEGKKKPAWVAGEGNAR